MSNPYPSCPHCGQPVPCGCVPNPVVSQKVRAHLEKFEGLPEFTVGSPDADQPEPAEILALEAGRELDALIGYHLFGWRWRRHTTWDVTPPDQKRGIRSTAVYTIFDGPPFFPTEWLSDPLDGFDKWREYAIDDGYDFRDPGDCVPPYSTDIAAAMILFRAVPAFQRSITGSSDGWHVLFTDGTPNGSEATGPELAVTICRASLIAAEASPLV